MDQISPSAILTTPQQLLDKLRWEIEALQVERDETIGQYRTFNCAITAWHAAEILHKVMTPEQKGNLATRTGYDIAKPGREGLSAFQAYLREYRPARIAQQVANSSKHLYVDKNTELHLSFAASAVGVS